MFSELFGFSGFCHFFHQRLRTFETDNWTCVVSFGGELNPIVSVWICDCFFKIEADFTHLFLRIQRSFPGLHGFSLLLLSSSGWSAASPVHLYSTIPRSGQRSEDGDQHTVPTRLSQLESLYTSSVEKLTSRSSMSFSSDRFGTSIAPLYLIPAFDVPGRINRVKMSAQIQSCFIPISFQYCDKRKPFFDQLMSCCPVLTSILRTIWEIRVIGFVSWLFPLYSFSSDSSRVLQTYSTNMNSSLSLRLTGPSSFQVPFVKEDKFPFAVVNRGFSFHLADFCHLAAPLVVLHAYPEDQRF